jgi:alpha-glucosidase
MRLYKIGFMLWLCVSAVNALAQIATLKSPDEKIAFQWWMTEGRLYFEVTKAGVPVIEKSPLVFSIDGKVLTADCTVFASQSYEVNETYAVRGVHAQAVNQANGLKMKMKSNSDKDFTVEARAYNDGIAFRLLYSGKPGMKLVPDEQTTFVLPAGSRMWYHDMYAHYEGIHQQKEITEVKEGEWAAPPVTVELPESQGYACITEAALKNYAGMSLQADGQCGLVTRLGHAQPAGYPFAHDYSLEEAVRLSVPAAIEGDILTPWRSIIIANDLNGLVNTDLITNLSPAPDKKLFPRGVHTDWVKPGRSVWCWLDGGERTVEGMKEFSRLAGELGFEYNTVDAFWYKWTDEQIKDLVDYSARFGVKIWLWRHGRDVRDPQKRKELFDRCQRLGIAGLKLDAFSHESKEFVDLYQACLKEAAEHKLMLNIHGSNKPTGELRTWPNEMSREGVHGLEYGKHQFEWTVHNVTLPFTRFVVGAGDYTPVIFGERRLETSWCHQIATALIFNSSVIFFGAHPQSIGDNPAADLFKTMPAEWDETIVLPDSKIGKVAAFARRKGETWYLAVLNGKEERTLQFPLSFLGEGWYEGTVYKDRPGDGASIKKERVFCRRTDSLTGMMRSGGGYIVRFTLKNK